MAVVDDGKDGPVFCGCGQEAERGRANHEAITRSRWRQTQRPARAVD